ncbi:Lysozyme [Pseudofrankia inefficax]|uniref:Lysozyme n=2 Tax=Pseudofrankia inefficax (strain DSM 45817 / CECT 9037 / DDB 130130 / EuI1c) TaxID=298654 RepID=E3J1C7_PSEI1|nr:Lysozyme [Pseudofrankia inefficax]
MPPTVAAPAPGPASAMAPTPAAVIAGIDVSKWQPSIDWRQVRKAGYQFAYVGAVGSYGENPSFRTQYDGAAAAGLYRGAYFFANPATATGTADADRFLAMTGRLNDGTTLWPVLDVERHPKLAACDGIGPAAWTSYIRAFLARVTARTGVTPMIYTAANFWRTCLQNTAAFTRTTRLWAAQPRTLSPQPFAGWPRLTFWQHSTGQVPGVTATTDRDTFFGTLADLRGLVVTRA